MIIQEQFLSSLRMFRLLKEYSSMYYYYDKISHKTILKPRVIIMVSTKAITIKLITDFYRLISHYLELKK